MLFNGQLVLLRIIVIDMNDEVNERTDSMTVLGWLQMHLNKPNLMYQFYELQQWEKTLLGPDLSGYLHMIRAN